MIDFAHEEVLLFLALLAFGNVLQGADEAHGPALIPGAVEIRKPQRLRPADLAVSPPEPELSRGAPRIDRIKRRLKVRLDHFHIVWVYPLHELFESRLIPGKVENFLRAGIPREHVVARIVPVRPELRHIEGELQTIFARKQ